MKEIESGVYRIKNTLNGKCYIGSSKNVHGRWRDHRKTLRNGCHHSILLQRAWNKHGEDNFKFSILEKCEKSQLIEREQHYKDLYKSYDRKLGYDVCSVAGSTLGTTLTIEHKKKLSLAHTGLKHSKETIDKISLASKGENNPMYGKRHTVESKRKISINTRSGMLASRASK